ncbi:MAG: hypothetical protein KU28_04895 [Sulfurovum sp. PC08-66]|nr:MAG: hypothetical protein KU28_04895 [Sulfurovum sp. PC08-66]
MGKKIITDVTHFAQHFIFKSLIANPLSFYAIIHPMKKDITTKDTIKTITQDIAKYILEIEVTEIL